MGAQGELDASGTSASKTSDDALKHVRFRSYTPRDDDLKKYQEEAIDPEQIVRDAVEEQDRMLMKAARNFANPKRDVENLVPKSINWELKRDLAPKLQKLRDKTDLAIVELMKKKQKVSSSQNVSIVKAVADIEARDVDRGRTTEPQQEEG